MLSKTGQIDDEENRVHLQHVCLVCDGGEGIADTAGEGDVTSCTCEVEGDRPADTSPGTDDESNLVLQDGHRKMSLRGSERGRDRSLGALFVERL